MPKKASASRRSGSKKTTARKAATAEKGVVSDALVKKVLKARNAGDTWDEIMENLDVKVGQITEIRARMRKLDPESVQNSGPRGSTAKKTTAKKTTGKKTTGRKSKKGRKVRKAGQTPRTEEA